MIKDLILVNGEIMEKKWRQLFASAIEGSNLDGVLELVPVTMAVVVLMVTI